MLHYLHGDHLLSSAVTTNSSGATSGDHRYYAYGRYRGGGELPTEQNFTSQKLDASGLMYFNARYYGPELGTFLSPDTLVPDPATLFDHNRYMYVRGNPLRFNDPTGHQTSCIANSSGSWDCNGATTGGQTLDINLSDEPQHGNPNGTGQFLTTMAGVGLVSFGGAFAAPYLASMLPAAAEGGAAVTTSACADGDCTNEIAATVRSGEYLSRVDKIRSFLNIGRGRNVAIADYNIEGASGELISVSGQAVRPGTLNSPTHRFFQTFVDEYPRDFDSEVKILEHIAHQFTGTNARGTLTLFTERTPCSSCTEVIKQFQQMFPDIVLTIITGSPQ